MTFNSTPSQIPAIAAGYSVVWSKPTRVFLTDAGAAIDSVFSLYLLTPYSSRLSLFGDIKIISGKEHLESLRRL